MDYLTLIFNLAIIVIVLGVVGGSLAVVHLVIIAIVRCPYCKSIKTKHEVHNHHNFICRKCKERFV